MRTPMVTRTITTTKATILCLDINEQKPCDIEVVLPRTYKTDADVLAKAKAKIETESLKAVCVKATEKVETLYGMSEDDFIKYAAELPARVKVEIEAETEAVAE